MSEGDLITLQPHTRRQQSVTRPLEVLPGTVYTTRSTVLVPESAAVSRCAVSWSPEVVVAVIRGELHAVVERGQSVHHVARVSSHYQLIVDRLVQYAERAVLGVVPVVAASVQTERHLIASAGRRQLTEQFVAEPVVAAGVVETDFELRPRTVEEVGSVGVLLDQQWDAVGYRTK